MLEQNAPLVEVTLTQWNGRTLSFPITEPCQHLSVTFYPKGKANPQLGRELVNHTVSLGKPTKENRGD